jgi:hypothetical protein
MNEFDLQLESGLRRYLDPISAVPVPPRRGKRPEESRKVELRVMTPVKLAVLPVEVY